MFRVPGARPIALFVLTALSGAALAGASATAATVIVAPGDPNWASTGNSGGGSSAVTGTAPRSGAGSLEMTGDRTRFVGLGNPFDPLSNLGLLSDVIEFTFEWSIAADSVSNLDPDYTPALRLHIFDGQQRSELIWEGAYNGAYGSTDPEIWYVTGADDNFWRFQTGLGETTDNGALVAQSIADWSVGMNSGGAAWYSDQAYVAAISVGVGSSVGAGYHAFADNVTLRFDGAEATTYNFEVVPEPVGIGLFGVALVALGAVRRRRISQHPDSLGRGPLR